MIRYFCTYARSARRRVSIIAAVLAIVACMVGAVMPIRSAIAAEKDKSEQGFSKLQRINPEVVGWINVYGTHVDYPLLHTTDNKKYLKTDPQGNYSELGAPFLDYRSNAQFKDFNTIIYGHDTIHGYMFGDIKRFTNAQFFDSHKYGSIYYDGRMRGLDVFAILQVDAYDKEVYTPHISDIEQKNAYYKYLLSKAQLMRNVSVSSADHIVMLSTCYESVTNGRHILLAKITDTVHEDPFAGGRTDSVLYTVAGAIDYISGRYSIALWILWLIIIVLLIVILVLITLIVRTARHGSLSKT
ncbi:class B sortase [Alloscardovia venturai]